MEKFYDHVPHKSFGCRRRRRPFWFARCPFSRIDPFLWNPISLPHIQRPSSPGRLLVATTTSPAGQLCPLWLRIFIPTLIHAHEGGETLGLTHLGLDTNGERRRRRRRGMRLTLRLAAKLFDSCTLWPKQHPQSLLSGYLPTLCTRVEKNARASAAIDLRKTMDLPGCIVVLWGHKA